MIGLILALMVGVPLVILAAACYAERPAELDKPDPDNLN